MILRFLRLFPAFRALEQDRDATLTALRESLQEQNTQNLLLQDRLDFAMEDRGKLWDAMVSAQSAKDLSYQMQINFATQQKFGVTPFPEATHLPPSSAPSPENLTAFGGFQLPSARIAQRTANWARNHAQRLHQTASGPANS